MRANCIPTYDEVEALLLSQILSSFSKLSSSPQVEVDLENTNTVEHHRPRCPIPFIAASEHKDVLVVVSFTLSFFLCW